MSNLKGQAIVVDHGDQYVAITRAHTVSGCFDWIMLMGWIRVVYPPDILQHFVFLALAEHQNLNGLTILILI